jgi:hypothetical protein
MQHWGKKLRSAVTNADEIEMLLLKQIVVVALSQKLSVSYNDRFYLHPAEDGYAISKSDDWAASVYFKSGQLGSACDKFIEQFVAEANFDPAGILVRSTVDGPGTPWKAIRRGIYLDALVNPELFGAIIGVLQTHETINSSAKESDWGKS